MSGRKEYSSAPEVAAIARRLIEKFHPHLAGARIEYLWVNKPPVIHGSPAAACLRKVSGLFAFLATPDFEGEPKPFFVMEVYRPLFVVRPDAWRVALVDHELKHGGREPKTGVIWVVPHDFEDFHDIAERHGAWDEGLQILRERLESKGGRIGVERPSLKNNRKQPNAVHKGAERKSEWKAPEVKSTH